MSDAIVFFAWCAVWCAGIWVAWWFGIRDARKDAPRKCRGVRLWNNNK